jgi:hypothetical protein
MCVSKARLVVPLAAAVLGVGGDRERQIYQLLAKGKANKDIANRLELRFERRSPLIRYLTGGEQMRVIRDRG